MALLTAPLPPILSLSFTGLAGVGQQVGYTAVTPAGDMFPLSGQGIVLFLKTVGTAVTLTVASVRLSSYGDDKDPTIINAATDEQQVFIKNDGRFDQGGINTGLVAVTYSATPTGALVRAITIPGM